MLITKEERDFAILCDAVLTNVWTISWNVLIFIQYGLGGDIKICLFSTRSGLVQEETRLFFPWRYSLYQYPGFYRTQNNAVYQLLYSSLFLKVTKVRF